MSQTEYVGKEESCEITFDSEDGALESVALYDPISDTYRKLANIENLPAALQIAIDKKIQRCLETNRNSSKFDEPAEAV